ncbi:nucleotidyltransferase domain-containing protein [Aureisphaera galaxeae]|uniref:nucleotidyltransferase domain-containing protein n=1 Tax=Aureisphaera galaxeae TaxID=1538023 RepID=UPI00234FF6E8|nr:nucleotidyltransferase domain-containing protein [Aureisphaera galaxeae]MDC8002911.1 nucleotidyltransferase domain-containing protein [Aureisphaera galaxeae]
MEKRLLEIEKNSGVDIFFACESGSRAWGFASPDSDFDVRFIYTHSIEWYMGVSEKRDTIDLMDGDFDAVGWELRKQLRLMKKSNVPALEHLFSPIIYKEDESLGELREIGLECFSSIACMYHYLSMSLKYLEKLEGDTMRLKDVFYALRTGLAGAWILEYKSMPPVVFSEMLSLTPDPVSDEIRNLMNLKATKNESYRHSRNELVLDFLTETIARNKEYAKSLPSGKPDSERIDHYLYKTVMS